MSHYEASDIAINIADITISVVRGSPDVELQLPSAFHKFMLDEASPDVRMRVCHGAVPRQISNERLFDSGGVWQAYRADGSYVFRFTSPVFGGTPYRVACFNRDFTAGDVCLHRPFFAKGEPVAPLEYPLDELLIVNLLARGRGAEIHACGAVDGAGNGHLFVGQSGAGKTTIARLLDNDGMTILSDDRIILRKLEGTMWMYGTPWHGEARFASPARAPLVGIYFLARGPGNELVLQRPSKAVGRLFACSFPLFYDPKALEFTLSFLDDVVKTAPCYELRFVPDEKVIDFLSKQIT